MATNLHSLKKFYQQHAPSPGLFLIRVLATEGTTFQKLGAAMMADTVDSTYQGLISGGCFERDVLAHCEGMAAAELAKIVEYDLGSEEDLFFGTGVGCPGKVTLLLERVQGDLGQILQDLFAATPSLPFWITEVNDTEQGVQSSNRLSMSRDTDKSSDFYLCEQFLPSRQAIIFGKGDLVAAVSQMFALMHYEHEIWAEGIVDRKAYPAAKRVQSIDSALFSWPNDFDFGNTDILLLTHNFHFDSKIIRSLLDRPVRYLGLLGADKRIDLLKREFIVAEWDRIAPVFFAPIGLPLIGREPQQIALSIVAELHQVRMAGERDSILAKIKSRPYYQPTLD